MSSLYSFSSDEEEISRKRSAKRPRTEPPNETSTITSLLFHDDQTGRKLLHPAAMRFALKLIETEGHRTTQLISQSLSNDGQVEESRRVQVRPDHHIKSIAANIRKRLREVPIPTKYNRIQDFTLNEMSYTNQHRRSEIRENQQVLQQLESQQTVLQTEFQAAKERKAKIEATLQEQPKIFLPVHPLLERFRDKECDGSGDDDDDDDDDDSKPA